MASRKEEKFLTLNWNDIFSITIKLSKKIADSNFYPDLMVAILRGGYIVAKILADIMDVKTIETLEIKFYKAIGETAERPIVVRPPSESFLGKKVLIVDDVADSGRTLQTAVDLVRLLGAKEIKTATLFLKPWSITIPDYYVSETDHWIVFPWELGEVLRELTLKRVNTQNAIREIKLLEKFDETLVSELINTMELFDKCKNKEINK